MSLFAAMLLTFALMLIMPLGLAAFWYFKNKNSVLNVKHYRTRDPRYFAKSFKKLITSSWGTRKGNKISLSSKAESFVDGDRMTAEDFKDPCDSIVLSVKKRFCPPQESEFRKEIYASQGAQIADESSIRAIYSEKNLSIGNNVVIDRWADADGYVVTGDNCDLGISLSSGSGLGIGKKCRFRRIYAPVIYIGVDSNAEKPQMRTIDQSLYKLKPSDERKHKRSVNDSDENDEGVIPYSFISRGRFKVAEDVIVQGSIRAHKGVMLGDGCVVCGSIFSDEDVHIGQNCVVMGDVFSQEDIYMETGACMGIPGETHSMIARGSIKLEDGCMAYGYLSNEAGAKISRSEEDELIPDDEFSDEELLNQKMSENKPGIFMGFLKRAVSTLGAFLMLGAVLLSCFGASYVAGVKYKAENRRPVRDVSRYRNQGLYFTEPIDDLPDMIGTERIDFADRALKRCTWTQEQENTHISAVRQLAGSIKARKPELGLYLMTQPLRIGFEEPFSQDQNYLSIVGAEKQKLSDYENRLLTSCVDIATPVYLIDSLSLYQNEYIFYRSAETWTARGAYYASQEFLTAAGLPTFPIESFHELTRKGIRGSLQNQTQDVSDKLYAYLYDNYNPVVNIADNGKKIPMYSVTRSITRTFMDGGYSTGQMRGLNENGRVLLIIGDNSARFVAPWMVNSFESIVAFNILNSDTENGALWRVLDYYGVTDVLIVDESYSVSNKRMARKFTEASY